jgi:ABC-type branched-subunit amino acid transport system ATPase component
MFTSLGEGRAMPRPSIAGTDKAYYYLVLALVVVTALVMVAVHAGRLGRILRGMADAPLAAAVLGLSTNVTRVIVFCISAFFAAVAGVLYGSTLHGITAEATFYQSFTSVIWIAILALAPFSAEPWYAVFAGLTGLIPAYLTGSDTPYWMNVAFGFFALMIAMRGGPHTMPNRLRAFFEQFGRRRAEAPALAEAPAPRPVAPVGDGERQPGLEVHELTVRFGGLVAVKGLTLSAPPGRITGLIGPNGAGKTTSFNACSGLVRPASGTIAFHGSDITHLGPPGRARRGLGRTFQIMELGESLTLAANVALGCEAAMAGARPLQQLVASRSERQTIEAATQSAMDLCGIAHLAHMQAGALSTGERRLVELARCLAGDFELLLLDEPSSGLDHSETVAFGDVLQRVVAERGTGILLVEHDMSLVMRVCAYIYVLDFGQLIFEGDSAAVSSSRVVQAAYLGSDSVAPLEVQVAAEEART